MKKNFLKINLSAFKYLLFAPLLLLSFCQTNDEAISLNAEKLLTKDAKVLSLMKAAVKSDLQKTSTKSEGTDVVDNQCTHFLYPMTFEVYSGDDPNPQLMEINSDDELIAFIDTLNTSNQFYMFFPITLLDSDGVETVINDLVELEGTLQMAVDACAGFNDGGGSGSGSDDGSGSGTDDGSDSSSDNASDNSSDDDSNHNSDNASDDDSDDDSNHNSDSASDDDSDDDSNHNSDSVSDDDSDDDSNHNSDSASNDDSDDDSDHASSDDHDEYEYCQDNNKKVNICHNGITICVSVNAIWGHMAHHENDYLGSCDE